MYVPARILEQIFAFTDLDTLKNARLACKAFDSCAAKMVLQSCYFYIGSNKRLEHLITPEEASKAAEYTTSMSLVMTHPSNNSRSCLTAWSRVFSHRDGGRGRTLKPEVREIRAKYEKFFQGLQTLKVWIPTSGFGATYAACDPTGPAILQPMLHAASNVISLDISLPKRLDPEDGWQAEDADSLLDPLCWSKLRHLTLQDAKIKTDSLVTFLLAHAETLENATFKGLVLDPSTSTDYWEKFMLDVAPRTRLRNLAILDSQASCLEYT